MKSNLGGRNLLVQKTSLGTILASCTHTSYLKNIEDDTKRIGLDISGNIKDGGNSSVMEDEGGEVVVEWITGGNWEVTFILGCLVSV